MIKTRIFLVLAFLFFLSYIGWLLTHESQRPVMLGRYSPAFFALLVIYFISLGFLLILCLLPKRLLKTLGRILKSLGTAPLIGKEPAIRSIEVLFLILASSLYLSLSSIYFAKNGRATDDEVAYLSTAIEIKERGGVGGFIRDVFRGKYLEANRHPLYILLLSPFAGRDLSFFFKAKMVSLLLGLIAVLVIYFVIRKHFGVIAAALAITFLVLNQAFLDASGKVACETLLVLFALLTWHFCTKLRPNWALAGVFSGLCYLTKASGLFLFLAILISLFVIRKLRTFKEQALWRVLAGFLVVAFPLLWRNSLVFKNPLYNKNNSVMWLESWEEKYRPEFEKSPPNLVTYLREQGLGQGLKRMHRGVAVESFVLIRALSPVGTLPLGILIGLFSLMAAFSGLRKEVKRERVFFTISFGGIFFLFFAWYSKIVPADRFVLPILPPLFGYSGRGLAGLVANLLQGRFARTRLERTGLAPIIIFLLLLLIPSIFAGYQARPFSSPALPQEYVALRQWMEENIGPHQRYLKGPDIDFQFEWHSHIRGEYLFFPLLENFGELNIYILRSRVNYCIITPQVIRERKRTLQEYFGWEEKRGLYERKRPPLWREIYRDQAAPLEFLVYSVGKG